VGIASFSLSCIEYKPHLADFFIDDASVAKRKQTPVPTWGRALERAMEASEALKTQGALAKRSGVAQSTIGRIIRGEVDPRSSILVSLAGAFGMSIAEFALMAQGDERPDPVGGPRRIPLIAMVRAGAFAEFVDNYPPGDAEDWLNCPRPCGPGTVALRVRGPSMAPLYQDGEIIFVDPGLAAGHGKDVVMRSDVRNEVTFKRLVIESERRQYLIPLNPQWPQQMIEIPPDGRIVGVVVGKWMDRVS
jgi:SOS-response transcriptional repressor LexA